MTAKPIIISGGKTIGYIQEQTSETWLLDRTGRLVAKYLKATDETIETSGRRIGKGNLLFSVIGGC